VSRAGTRLEQRGLPQIEPFNHLRLGSHASNLILSSQYNLKTFIVANRTWRPGGCMVPACSCCRHVDAGGEAGSGDDVDTMTFFA